MSNASILSSSPPLSPAWMSWWDRYFAPGDLRRRRQHPATTQPPPAPSPSTTTTSANDAPSTSIPPTTSTQHAPPRLDPAHRARRQNALLFGGLTFTLLSLALTRRSIQRKRLAAYPATFTPSHMHIAPPPSAQQEVGKVEGSLMAIEALGLATLNVVSVFMAGIGGAMAWFDVGETEDLRRKVEGGGGFGGEADEEAEREVEGWIAGAFGGRGGNEGTGLGSEALRQGVLENVEELREGRRDEGEGKT